VNCFYSIRSGDWHRKAAEDTTAFGYIACTYLTSISNKHIKQAYQTSIPNGKRDCIRICYSSREHPMGIHLASKYRRSNFAARPGVLVGVPWIATEPPRLVERFCGAWVVVRRVHLWPRGLDGRAIDGRATRGSGQKGLGRLAPRRRSRMRELRHGLARCLRWVRQVGHFGQHWEAWR
jgi:hypothetical protein